MFCSATTSSGWHILLLVGGGGSGGIAVGRAINSDCFAIVVVGKVDDFDCVGGGGGRLGGRLSVEQQERWEEADKLQTLNK